MYLPEQFLQRDRDKITALLREYPFATLISSHGEGTIVSQLPLLYEPDSGDHGRLLGHLARANPQCQQLANGDNVLVLFHGPHAYVSPTWYESFGVPTWNYTTIQMSGRVKIIDETDGILAILEQQTHRHEANMPLPWPAELPDSVVQRLPEMVRGLTIEVLEVRAKFKLSQNRSVAERQRIAREIEATGNRALADLILEDLQGD